MRHTDTLIFTDLDGSLLDHHHYGHAAAAPALARVRAQRIPLIMATSKTLAEVGTIATELGSHYPAIVENGGALCFPLACTCPSVPPPFERHGGHRVVLLSPHYARLRRFVETMREQRGWPLRGFGDMDADEVSRRTGLTTAGALAAKDRLCSEPFVWDGDERALTDLREQAGLAGLAVTRGGRFWHLTGDTDKARAMLRMSEMYRDCLGGTPTLVALGDSDNDTQMLQQADIAVVIRRHDGSHLAVQGRHETLRTVHPGPAGWNAAVLQILAGLTPPDPENDGD